MVDEDWDSEFERRIRRHISWRSTGGEQGEEFIADSTDYGHIAFWEALASERLLDLGLGEFLGLTGSFSTGHGQASFTTSREGSRLLLKGINAKGLRIQSSPTSNAIFSITLEDCTLPELDLSSLRLNTLVIRNSTVRGAKLEDLVIDPSRLKGLNSIFENLELDGVDIFGADLRATMWIGCRRFDQLSGLDGQWFTNSTFSGCDFSNTSFDDVNFEGATFTKNTGVDVRWRYCNFTRAELDHDFSSWSDGTLIPFGAASPGTQEVTHCNFTHANLSGAGFRGANLISCNFHRATLTNADFTLATLKDPEQEKNRLDMHRAVCVDADFTQASLTIFAHHANFQKAQFFEADFTGSDIAGADFREAKMRAVSGWRRANFRDANFKNTKSLLGKEFAGIDLTGVQVPEPMGEFFGLAQVSEISKHARNTFLTMLAVCLYTWLILLSKFLSPTESGESETINLPMVNVELAPELFSYAAPILILATYIYLILYLQRMWEALACLPAVFPDGASLTERSYPWLLSGFAQSFGAENRSRRPLGWILQAILSISLGYFAVPVTLLASLFIQEASQVGSGLEFTWIAFTSSAVAGTWAIRNMVATLAVPPLEWVARRRVVFLENVYLSIVILLLSFAVYPEIA